MYNTIQRKKKPKRKKNYIRGYQILMSDTQTDWLANENQHSVTRSVGVDDGRR